MAEKHTLIVNKARCRKCNDIVISAYRHDFKKCKCGNIFVDGGLDYLRRGAASLEDIEELSEWKPCNKKDCDYCKPSKAEKI